MPRLIHLFRMLAWLAIVLLAYLSLVPHEMEVRTGLPGHYEHAIAYGLTAAIFALAFPGRLRWAIVVGLFTYSFVLEFLQLLVPGRTYSPLEPLVSGAGAAIGMLLVRAFLHPVRPS